MTRTEILLEILGDDTSEIIAQSLENSYKALQRHTDEIISGAGVAIYDCYDKNNEIKQTRKMMKALKKAHTWYAVKGIQ